MAEGTEKSLASVDLMEHAKTLRGRALWIRPADGSTFEDLQTTALNAASAAYEQAAALNELVAVIWALAEKEMKSPQ